MEIDLTYQLVKHLFLENVLKNTFIRSAFLNNQINNLADLEDLAKLEFTDKFMVLIEKYQDQIQKKQQEIESKEEVK